MFGIPLHPDLRADDRRQARGRFHGCPARGKLREFLDKHLPSEGELAAEADADEAQALESGDTQAALQKLADALAADPANDDAL
jgi:putative thioredoxin